MFYRLMPGSTAQTNKFHTFYLQQRPENGDTWADIKVNHPLDYESIKEYNLTIRVEVRREIFNRFGLIKHPFNHHQRRGGSSRRRICKSIKVGIRIKYLPKKWSEFNLKRDFLLICTFGQINEFDRNVGIIFN